jgi:MFS family permease
MAFCKKLLDKSSNWKFSIFVLSLSCFFENLIISGSSTVVLSTIEREFFMSSTESGFFLGIYELAGFISAPLFGFFCRRANRMRLISLSLLLVSIGAYIIGLMIFLKKPFVEFLPRSDQENASKVSILYQHSDTDSLRETKHVFFDNSMRDRFVTIRSKDEFSSNLVAFLYIGQLIIGFGATAIYIVCLFYS